MPRAGKKLEQFVNSKTNAKQGEAPEEGKSVPLGWSAAWQQSFGMPDDNDYVAYMTAYKKIGLLRSMIDKITAYIVKRGYEIICDDEAEKEELEAWLKKINWNDKFKMAVKLRLIVGNAYLEKIFVNGMLENLKSINPIGMRIRRESSGKIIEYKLQRLSWLGGKSTAGFIPFKPEEICHFRYNVIADEAYGTGIVESMWTLLENKLNVEEDYISIMRHYAKPIRHYKVGTENDITSQDAIDELKEYLESNEIDAETDIVTDGKTSCGIISQGSAIKDPFQYLEFLTADMIGTGAVPDVLLGRGEAGSEAKAKVQLECFESDIESQQNQLKMQIETEIFKPWAETHGYSEVPEIKFPQISPEDDNIVAARLIQLRNAGIPLKLALEMVGWEEWAEKVPEPIDPSLMGQPGQPEKPEKPLQYGPSGMAGMPENKNIPIQTESMTGDLFKQTIHKAIERAEAAIGVNISPETYKSVSLALEEDKLGMVASLTKTEKNKAIEIIKKGILEGSSVKKITKNLMSVAKDLTEAEVERIIRTELNRAFTNALITSLDESGVVKSVKWYAIPTACPECLAQSGKEFSLTKAEGKIPHHPNCRCNFLAVIKRGNEEKEIEIIPYLDEGDL